MPEVFEDLYRVAEGDGWRGGYLVKMDCDEHGCYCGKGKDCDWLNNDNPFDDRCDICREPVGPEDETKTIRAYWGHKKCIEEAVR